MAIFRLYAGDDGQSHIEETSLADHPELTEAQAASSISFREWPPGHFIDWHPAPRRQYIISLGGEIEIGLGDGTTVRYGPGDARLVEDTSGQGHTTRVVGNAPSLTAVIPWLAERTIYAISRHAESIYAIVIHANTGKEAILWDRLYGFTLAATAKATLRT